jgi:hypothetical protein
METLNIKAEARSLSDKLPDNFTWSDLIAAIDLRKKMQSPVIKIQNVKSGIDEVAGSSPKPSRFGSDR